MNYQSSSQVNLPPQASRPKSQAPCIRCAIYTRKSTDEGLEQEFNSLDAQREAAEAYILSQRHEGWECLPDRYDDGGFTGGNMDRPALRRLVGDIESGKVDCIVVYKVDRLSRSLLDFARIMQTLDSHNVSFVSVTQQFNTTSSMGRLTLNILLSFAQFEREIISERTRDKVRAARRKGKWTGGKPILGYDVDPNGGKLLVNEEEAVQVRAMFQLYIEQETLLNTVKELKNRGWCNKRWTTRKGKESGGIAFNKSTLHKLLTNVFYIGRMTCNGEHYNAEHPPIVDDELFQKVQAQLKSNGHAGGHHLRHRFGSLLKGLIRCAPCGCAMIPSSTTRNDRKYRYYVCLNAQKHGWHTCPSKSIPAHDIEGFVVDQIRSIGSDRSLVAEAIRQAREQGQIRIKELVTERKILERQFERDIQSIRDMSGELAYGGTAINRLADLQDRIRNGEQRITQINEELIKLEREGINEAEAKNLLAMFGPVWDTLNARERFRLVRLLVEQVNYNGDEETVSITFHPTGIKALTHDHAEAS